MPLKEYFSCCKREFKIELLKKSLIDAQGNYSRVCSFCASGNPTLPDVYIGKTSGAVMYEENIADPKTGQPIPFYDKVSKKAAMKLAGVREAGDRINGARNEDLLHRKKYFV